MGLIPLWLYLYSSSYTGGGEEIKVPYGPICRTLSILITALFLGIAFRRFSSRIGPGFSRSDFPLLLDLWFIPTENRKSAKKISKFGTILSLLVILTFVVFGQLFYEDAWKVDSTMWICVICIPMLGYIIGELLSISDY